MTKIYLMEDWGRVAEIEGDIKAVLWNVSAGADRKEALYQLMRIIYDLYEPGRASVTRT